MRPRDGSSRRESVVAYITGMSLLAAALGMALSALVDLWAGGDAVRALAICAAIVGVPAVTMIRLSRPPERLPAASIFSAVLSSWIALSLVSTLPYLLTHTFTRFDHALFESLSGFTTTNATLLKSFASVSRGVLFWRALTQWMGGVGFVVFAVSVLPFLGAAGMDLADTPGATTGRLGPRVRETARRLVVLYVVFTGVVAVAYTLGGMSTFDAAAHALTTVSTGGFSTHSDSFAHFASPSLQWIAIASMVVAGSSFALYWRALRGKPLAILRSTELRAYVAILALLAAAAVMWNARAGQFTADDVRHTIFQTVSLATTTGYTIGRYTLWPVPVQLLLIFAMGLGGMSASTAGGFKVFRLLAVLSYSRRRLFRQLHPRAVDVIRFGSEIVPEAAVARIAGFFGMFMAIGGLATFLVAAFGADIVTAISSVASAIGNVGPALGAASSPGSIASLSTGARWVLAVVMLTGRLEVFPVLLGAVPLMRFVADRLPAPVTRAFLRLGRG